MSFWSFSRLVSTVVVFILILSACSSSEGETEAADASSATATSLPVAEEDSTDTTTPAESPATTVDNRTDREKAIDQLDLMLVQLRVEDLVATADCVVDRLDEEGIEIVGQGAPELVAAVGCDRALATQLFSVANFGVSEVEGTCIVDQLADATAVVPLEDAEAYFSTPKPPDDVLQTIATDCDVPLTTLEQGFS